MSGAFTLAGVERYAPTAFADDHPCARSTRQRRPIYLSRQYFEGIVRHDGQSCGGQRSGQRPTVRTGGSHVWRLPRPRRWRAGEARGVAENGENKISQQGETRASRHCVLVSASRRDQCRFHPERHGLREAGRAHHVYQHARGGDGRPHVWRP